MIRLYWTQINATPGEPEEGLYRGVLNRIAGTVSSVEKIAAPGNPLWVSFDTTNKRTIFTDSSTPLDTVNWTLYKGGTTTSVAFHSSCDGIDYDSTNNKYVYAASVTVNRVNPDGTGDETIVSGQTGATGLVLFDSYIYWSDTALMKINRADLDGNNVTTIWSGSNQPFGLTVTEQYIYFVKWASGHIVRVDRADGANEIDILGGLTRPISIDLSDDWLYYCDVIDDKIGRVRTDGTGAADVLTSRNGAFALKILNEPPGAGYWAEGQAITTD